MAIPRGEDGLEFEGSCRRAPAQRGQPALLLTARDRRGDPARDAERREPAMVTGRSLDCGWALTRVVGGRPMVWGVGAGAVGGMGEWGCANLGRMAGLLLLPQPR